MNDKAFVVDPIEETASDAKKMFKTLMSVVMDGRKRDMVFVLNLGTTTIKLTGTETFSVEHTRRF